MHAQGVLTPQEDARKLAQEVKMMYALSHV